MMERNDNCSVMTETSESEVGEATNSPNFSVLLSKARGNVTGGKNLHNIANLVTKDIKTNYRKSIVKRAVHPALVSSTPFCTEKTNNLDNFSNFSTLSGYSDQPKNDRELPNNEEKENIDIDKPHASLEKIKDPEEFIEISNHDRTLTPGNAKEELKKNDSYKIKSITSIDDTSDHKGEKKKFAGYKNKVNTVKQRIVDRKNGEKARSCSRAKKPRIEYDYDTEEESARDLRRRRKTQKLSTIPTHKNKIIEVRKGRSLSRKSKKYVLISESSEDERSKRRKRSVKNRERRVIKVPIDDSDVVTKRIRKGKGVSRSSRYRYQIVETDTSVTLEKSETESSQYYETKKCYPKYASEKKGKNRVESISRKTQFSRNVRPQYSSRGRDTNFLTVDDNHFREKKRERLSRKDNFDLQSRRKEKPRDITTTKMESTKDTKVEDLLTKICDILVAKIQQDQKGGTVVPKITVPNAIDNAKKKEVDVLVETTKPDEITTENLAEIEGDEIIADADGSNLNKTDPKFKSLVLSTNAIFKRGNLRSSRVRLDSLRKGRIERRNILRKIAKQPHSADYCRRAEGVFPKERKKGEKRGYVCKKRLDDILASLAKDKSRKNRKTITIGVQTSLRDSLGLTQVKKSIDRMDKKKFTPNKLTPKKKDIVDVPQKNVIILQNLTVRKERTKKEVEEAENLAFKSEKEENSDKNPRNIMHGETLSHNSGLSSTEIDIEVLELTESDCISVNSSKVDETEKTASEEQTKQKNKTDTRAHIKNCTNNISPSQTLDSPTKIVDIDSPHSRIDKKNKKERGTEISPRKVAKNERAKNESPNKGERKLPRTKLEFEDGTESKKDPHSVPHEKVNKKNVSPPSENIKIDGKKPAEFSPRKTAGNLVEIPEKVNKKNVMPHSKKDLIPKDGKKPTEFSPKKYDIEKAGATPSPRPVDRKSSPRFDKAKVPLEKSPREKVNKIKPDAIGENSNYLSDPSFSLNSSIDWEKPTEFSPRKAAKMAREYDHSVDREKSPKKGKKKSPHTKLESESKIDSSPHFVKPKVVLEKSPRDKVNKGKPDARGENSNDLIDRSLSLNSKIAGEKPTEFSPRKAPESAQSVDLEKSPKKGEKAEIEPKKDPSPHFVKPQGVPKKKKKLPLEKLEFRDSGAESANSEGGNKSEDKKARHSSKRNKSAEKEESLVRENSVATDENDGFSNNVQDSGISNGSVAPSPKKKLRASTKREKKVPENLSLKTPQEDRNISADLSEPQFAKPVGVPKRNGKKLQRPSSAKNEKQEKNEVKTNRTRARTKAIEKTPEEKVPESGIRRSNREKKVVDLDWFSRIITYSEKEVRKNLDSAQNSLVSEKSKSTAKSRRNKQTSSGTATDTTQSSATKSAKAAPQKVEEEDQTSKKTKASEQKKETPPKDEKKSATTRVLDTEEASGFGEIPSELDLPENILTDEITATDSDSGKMISNSSQDETVAETDREVEKKTLAPGKRAGGRSKSLTKKLKNKTAPAKSLASKKNPSICAKDAIENGIEILDHGGIEKDEGTKFDDLISESSEKIAISTQKQPDFFETATEAEMADSQEGSLEEKEPTPKKKRATTKRKEALPEDKTSKKKKKQRTSEIPTDEEPTSAENLTKTKIDIEVHQQIWRKMTSDVKCMGKKDSEIYKLTGTSGFFALAPKFTKAIYNDEYEQIFYRLEGTFSLKIGEALLRNLPNFIIPKGVPAEFRNTGKKRVLFSYTLR